MNTYRYEEDWVRWGGIGGVGGIGEGRGKNGYGCHDYEC